MAFLDTTAGEAGSEAAQQLRDGDRAAAGYLPNYAVTFTMRPGVYAAWKALSAAVRQPMDTYRYELATVAAACALRSSYCTLAHGKVLDATGTRPDAAFGDLPPELRQALTVGRPIDGRSIDG